MTMGRTLVLGGWAFLAGALALGGGAASASAREVPQSFDNGVKVAAPPPSEAELMYEAMKRSGRGGKNDAAIDRALARAQKDSEKSRKALRMELAARSWKDPFVDDVDPSAMADSQRGGDDEVGAARADAARARKETARAKAEAAAARREAARIKADAARSEAVAQADAALARAEAARANAVAAKAEAAAALSDAQAARASCGALRTSGDGTRNVHRPLASRTPAAPKRFPTMGRARLASVTVSRTTQPAEAPPPVVDDIPKAPPQPPAPANGAPAAATGFIVVPIPPAPPVEGQSRAGRRPSS